jgi:nitric oxide reductase NorD protein
LNKDLVNSTVRGVVDDPSSDRGIDRLGLLASAIGGRTLGIVDAGVGQRAWTDGTTVFVDADADPTDQVRMVTVQASLLAAGSLAPDIVRQLVRRPALARRYLAVEGHRALAANEALLPEVARTLLAGTSPDTVLQREADGATKQPGRLVRPPVNDGLATGDGDPERSLAIARGRRSIEEPPELFGVIRPRRLLDECERVDAGAQPQDGDPRPLSNQTRSRVEALDDEAEYDDGRSVGHLLSSPVGGRGVLGRLLQRLLRPTRAPGGGGPAGADAPTHGSRARSGGRGKATSTSGAPEALDSTAAFAPPARTYPEWDVHRRRYRPDWCTVHERDPRPGDLAPMAMPDGRALRRPLARLGAGLVRTRRQPQGDDIDIDAAVEARVEALAGLPPDESVYVESLRRRRDLAVLVLLDVSGSAREPGPAGRTVHEHQRLAAAGLTTALHDLGDRVALYAFNSQGRRAVHLTRVKGFDDRLDGGTVRRIGGLVPGAYTRLGAAIRHGGSVLDTGGGTSRRLLLVLSDGFAYDHGYEGAYGEADARRALAEVRRQGTGCLCLSVGAGTRPAVLRRVFGTAAHATIPTPDQLPGLVGPLFRAALLSAEAQRRVFQRRERSLVQHGIGRATP